MYIQSGVHKCMGGCATHITARPHGLACLSWRAPPRWWSAPASACRHTQPAPLSGEVRTAVARAHPVAGGHSHTARTRSHPLPMRGHWRPAAVVETMRRCGGSMAIGNWQACVVCVCVSHHGMPAPHSTLYDVHAIQPCNRLGLGHHVGPGTYGVVCGRVHATSPALGALPKCATCVPAPAQHLAVVLDDHSGAAARNLCMERVPAWGEGVGAWRTRGPRENSRPRKRVPSSASTTLGTITCSSSVSSPCRFVLQ